MQTRQPPEIHCERMGEHTTAIVCGGNVVGHFLAIPLADAAAVRREIMVALPDLLGEQTCTLRPARWSAVGSPGGGARLIDSAGTPVVVISCRERAHRLLSRIASPTVGA